MTDSKQYPIILEVKHIQEILGIGKRRAYELMDLKDFPLIKLGRTKRVQRDQFFKWLEDQSKKEA